METGNSGDLGHLFRVIWRAANHWKFYASLMQENWHILEVSVALQVSFRSPPPWWKLRMMKHTTRDVKCAANFTIRIFWFRSCLYIPAYNHAAGMKTGFTVYPWSSCIVRRLSRILVLAGGATWWEEWRVVKRELCVRKEMECWKDKHGVVWLRF